MKHWLDLALGLLLIILGITGIAIVGFLFYGTCILVDRLSIWVASQRFCVGTILTFLTCVHLSCYWR